MYDLILPTIARFLLSCIPIAILVIVLSKEDIMRSKGKEIFKRVPIIYTVLEKIITGLWLFLYVIFYVNMAFWGYCLMMFACMFLSFHLWEALFLGLIIFACCGTIEMKFENMRKRDIR